MEIISGSRFEDVRQKKHGAVATVCKPVAGGRMSYQPEDALAQHVLFVNRVPSK